VFNLIVRRARLLCDANAAGLYEYDGSLMHFRAADPDLDNQVVKAFRSRFPMPPGPDSVVGRVILEQRIFNVADVGDEPGLHRSVRDLGGLSAAGIPLIRDGQPVGAIVIDSKCDGGLSNGQISLLQTFAEQAVIAITSAETYRALQARTADLQE